MSDMVTSSCGILPSSSIRARMVLVISDGIRHTKIHL
jgi:hypothetical protein